MSMITPDLIWFATILAFVAWAIVNIVFAIGVFADATRMLNDAGRNTELVPGPMWAFATLIGGVFVAAVYWLIHHSTLSNRRL